ncbi:hypothetical protein KKE45_03145 [Patescibacteria group bacterium]|nr:hypothetical protein [Patescibacteria group bacterium]
MPPSPDQRLQQSQPEAPTPQQLASILVSQIQELNTNWDPDGQENLQAQLNNK